jgi:hypothetical protein
MINLNYIHLPFMTVSTRNICKEPDELVAIRISGISKDGANAREYIVDEYVPLLKLYDCMSSHNKKKKKK